MEIYFRTLKTGCRVEKIQLETMSRLKNCLAFYKIIAWRILYLTYLNRTTPVPLLTRLGGYNNRPSEPPPGPQVMWTAIRRMLDFATAWLTFGPKT